MDIVKLNVYADAYYNGPTYDEDVVISKSLYEKIKADLDKYDSKNNKTAKGIYIGELDSKNSEVEGYLSVEIYLEDEVADCDWNLNEDGGMLYFKVKDICDKKNLDLDEDIKSVQDSKEKQCRKSQRICKKFGAKIVLKFCFHRVEKRGDDPSKKKKTFLKKIVISNSHCIKDYTLISCEL